MNEVTDVKNTLAELKPLGPTDVEVSLHYNLNLKADPLQIIEMLGEVTGPAHFALAGNIMFKLAYHAHSFNVKLLSSGEVEWVEHRKDCSCGEKEQTFRKKVKKTKRCPTLREATADTAEKIIKDVKKKLKRVRGHKENADNLIKLLKRIEEHVLGGVDKKTIGHYGIDENTFVIASERPPQANHDYRFLNQTDSVEYDFVKHKFRLYKNRRTTSGWVLAGKMVEKMMTIPEVKKLLVNPDFFEGVEIE
jgi:hypothetical protein